MAGGAHSRRKGARAELEQVNALVDAGYRARRALDSMRRGHDGRDIEIDAPLCIQVRARRNGCWALTALEDATASADAHETPVGVCRVDRGRSVAVVDLDAFLGVYILAGSPDAVAIGVALALGRQGVS